ncbi:hypothetical protein COMNV_01785 [Commensalibacter sp. Nvir]|uniref:glycosyltransferase n=1 Tax=Commensalibacter sp. Nvir TaxID=3069817 RepID=UPI002D5D205A|nr:hypothetical protein COMNV_01785 [Commensalibacter sp. Nvir]
MIDDNKLALIDEHQKKIDQAREKARIDAQYAFEKALEEKKRGDYTTALRWIERAHRLANKNPTINFEMAMIYWKLAQLDEASKLFSSLMKEYNFIEGWLSLVLIKIFQKNYQETLVYLNKILSSYGISPFIWSTLIRALKKIGLTNICCVDGSLKLIRVHSLSTDPISVFLDDQFQFTSNAPEFALPQTYFTKQKLSLYQNGKHLHGSPIDILSIIQTESFVEFDKGLVKGWIWFPMQPERLPFLSLYSNQRLIEKIQVIQEIDKNPLDRPFFRPRSFSFVHKGDRKKPLFLKNEYGKQLLGSPLVARVSTLQHTIKNSNSEGKGHVSSCYPSSSNPKEKSIAIIIPIYKGVNETLECLYSVIDTLTLGAVIQMVNDGSMDAELINTLMSYVDNKKIFMAHHKQNLGFPSAVNTGIKLWPDHDILLLNSDTLVPKGWIETLQSVAYAQKKIGTVTPFSNNAGIFSYPSHVKMNAFPSLAQINRYTKIMTSIGETQYEEIPTGYGFCMFIRRDCIEETGGFREDIFSQGYGEENDFCMRAKALGWLNVLATGIFVGHRGGVSFGALNLALMKRNFKILNKIHPYYRQLIKDFRAKDPLRCIRRRIDKERVQEFLLMKASQKKPIQSVLIITHKYGGGVERSVQERINQIVLKNYMVVVLRPGTTNKECTLDLCYKIEQQDNKSFEGNYPNLRYDLPGDYAQLCEQLSLFHIQWTEVHHFIGHHDKIHDLLKDINKPYDFFIHDYYVFCPRITLIDYRKKLCMQFESTEVCQNCLSHSKKFINTSISFKYWLKRSTQELLCSQRIYVPSQDALERVTQCFPLLSNIVVSPLEDDNPGLSLDQLAYFSLKKEKNTSSYVTHKNRIFKICIIGAIGAEKGFFILKKLLKDADERNLPIEFVLVGWSCDDRQLLESKRIFITGPYLEDEAVALVAQQHADLAFFPNIWPETWCYTLSIAWRAGLKTVSFDMGAIAERIKSTKRGCVLPNNISIQNLNDSLLRLCN